MRAPTRSPTAKPAPSAATPPAAAAVARSNSSGSSNANGSGSGRYRRTDSDSDDDGGDNEEGKRLNLKSVLLADAAERRAEALAARSAGGSAEAAASTVAGTREILAGAPDVVGAPLLPAQADEDNELYYCPRLSVANLQRVTGEQDLRRVTTLALHLNTEEQELDLLSSFLPALRCLALIPPSSVSSFRDFGRSLRAIESLALPRCGLTDLDGIEVLERLVELAVPANQLSDLSPLMFAPALTAIDLRDNQVREADMVEFVGALAGLRSLDLEGNPLAMKKAYRNIVGSRCTEVPDGQLVLDGTPLQSAERERLSDAQEGAVDREKQRAWQARVDSGELASAYSHPGSGGGLMQRLAAQQGRSAVGSSLSVQAPQPPFGGPASGTRPSREHTALGAGALSSTASSSLSSSSLGSASASAPGGTSQSAAAVAARRREFQQFLDNKSADGGASFSAEQQQQQQQQRLRREREKNSAVADILRLENELDSAESAAFTNGAPSTPTAGSGSAQRLLDARLANQGGIAAGAGSGASVVVPRLQFDASFAASPAGSPVGVAPINPFNGLARPGSSSGRADRPGAPVAAPALSLSTPRPSTSGGGRPGSASGMRPGTASGGGRGSSVFGEDGAGGGDGNDGSAPAESASDLTFGSSTVMAGGFAQAMRARKKNSISLSSAQVSAMGLHSYSGGGGGGGGSDDSRSPSSTSRPAVATTQPSHSKYSRSASPAPAAAHSATSSNTTSAAAAAAMAAVAAASVATAGPPVGIRVSTNAAHASNPPLSGGSGAPPSLASPVSRPLIGGGSALMARHRQMATGAAAAHSPSPSPLHAPISSSSLLPQLSPSSSARRQDDGDDEVIFTIGKPRSAAAAPAAAHPIATPTATATATATGAAATVTPTIARPAAGKTYTLVRKPPVAPALQ